MTRQSEQEMAAADDNGHLANMGRMIEEMENRMRDSLQDVYFGKSKSTVNKLYSAGGMQIEDAKKALANNLQAEMGFGEPLVQGLNQGVLLLESYCHSLAQLRCSRRTIACDDSRRLCHRPCSRQCGGGMLQPQQKKLSAQYVSMGEQFPCICGIRTAVLMQIRI